MPPALRGPRRVLLVLTALLTGLLVAAAPANARPKPLRPPTVGITAPQAGQTVSGTAVTLDATTSRYATSVAYLVDGVQVASMSGCCTWQTTWDSTTVPDGSHSVVARASDSAGTTTSAPVSFTVANSSTSPPPPPPPGTRQVQWGMHVANDYEGLSEVSSLESQLGKHTTIVHGYQEANSNFDATGADAVVAHGDTPMLTLEPWTNQVDDPSWSLSSILTGQHDSFFTQQAQLIAGWGGPLYLRFAHEMNGDWYPWGVYTNGNTVSEYAPAFRHVHDLFAAAGATNVRWVWCPNQYDGNASFADLYPGDGYVDWTCVDGYNWGGTSWSSPSQIFDSSLAQLAAVAPSKPVMIGETGSVEDGGDKAQWFTDLLSTYIANHTAIGALVYFNEAVPGDDWRIQTSSTALSAFGAGIRDPLYAAQP